MVRPAPPPFGHLDRVLYLGAGQLRGRHGDVLGARREVSTVRFDGIGGHLVLTSDLHPIPRRPKPDF